MAKTNQKAPNFEEIDGKIVKMPELDGMVWDQCHSDKGVKNELFHIC